MRSIDILGVVGALVEFCFSIFSFNAFRLCSTRSSRMLWFTRGCRISRNICSNSSTGGTTETNETSRPYCNVANDAIRRPLGCPMNYSIYQYINPRFVMLQEAGGVAWYGLRVAAVRFKDALLRGAGSPT
jgi:hypothetical protein